MYTTLGEFKEIEVIGPAMWQVCEGGAMTDFSFPCSCGQKINCQFEIQELRNPACQVWTTVWHGTTQRNGVSFWMTEDTSIKAFIKCVSEVMLGTCSFYWGPRVHQWLLEEFER